MILPCTSHAPRTGGGGAADKTWCHRRVVVTSTFRPSHGKTARLQERAQRLEGWIVELAAGKPILPILAALQTHVSSALVYGRVYRVGLGKFRLWRRIPRLETRRTARNNTYPKGTVPAAEAKEPLHRGKEKTA